jgi:hypothetical protein
VSDIVERLLDYSKDDHERGCTGRCYECSCGYDDKRDPLMVEAADEITRLRAEAENQVQWVRDLADNLITEEAKTAALRARVARLEEALRVVFQPGGWTHGDDCRCEACCRARAALEKTGDGQ